MLLYGSVTTDYVSAKMFLRSISIHSGKVRPLGGYSTVYSFSLNLGKQGFDSDREDHEDDPVPIAKEAAQQSVQVHCIGIGSETGKPIQWTMDLC